MKNGLKAIQIAVPLSRAEIQKLDGLRRNGVMKGRWVAEAIREKLDREPPARKPA